MLYYNWCQIYVAGSNTVPESDQQTSLISAERPSSVISSSSNFTRTVWLPRPVDGASVSAKLQDGVLTLTIPKADDKGSVKVAIQ